MDAFVNLGSFLIQFANILVIIIVMKLFLFKPYMAYLSSEEKKRKELEKAHEDMTETKKKANKDIESLIDEAKKEAESIKKNAEHIAKKESVDIIESAKNETQKMKEKASLDIENEKKILYAELKDKILDVAIKLNWKLFSKSDSNKEFIEKSLKEEKI